MVPESGSYAAREGWTFGMHMGMLNPDRIEPIFEIDGHAWATMGGSSEETETLPVVVPDQWVDRDLGFPIAELPAGTRAYLQGTELQEVTIP